MKTDVENQLHIKRCSCGNLIVATVRSARGPSICHFATRLDLRQVWQPLFPPFTPPTPRALPIILYKLVYYFPLFSFICFWGDIICHTLAPLPVYSLMHLSI